MKIAGIIHAQNRASEIMSSPSFRVEQAFRDSHRKRLSENGWLMARPTVSAPIAGATNRAPLKELIGATTLKIDEASMELLNRAKDWRNP
jgi:aryl-alcohol dehydrogenase-like predicted oxidoreductase